MDWVELILPAGEIADEVAALLACTDDVAAAGAEVRGEEVVLWAPAGEADGRAAELRRAAARLRDAGLDVDPARVRVRPAAPEDEWRDAWKRYFHVARLGRRLVIVPSWERFEPGPTDLVLDLDPGRAFGTGAHASTRLCLIEAERLCDDDGLRVRTFLDVGTGSAILAIAAARLWPAARGLALDIDPEAVGAARENVARNGVEARVAVAVGDAAAAPAEPAELVLANIQADVLRSMRDELARRVAPGGALILSGLLAPEVEPVADEFARGTGLARVRTARLPDDPAWGAALLRRDGETAAPGAPRR